ncbi:conjugal transfer protein TraH [Amycolatopsis sp. NPDC049253]|uniref:conjugal transfer protein TraH n=1 Tax=Amycolatopsis sp. NPDC049253 TaxID=3155274 RepID=UPI003419B0E3
MTTRHTTCTRTEAATQWIAWHFAELLAVAAPLVLGWLVAGWLALGSFATAAAWGVHELTAHRRARAALTSGPSPRQISNDTTDESASAQVAGGRDENREGA